MEHTQLEELKKLAQEHIQNATDTNALNDIRVKYLGKKGEITTMLKAMKDLSPEERPKFGQMVNAIREQIEIELNQHMTELQEKAKEVRMAAETIDVTLPAKKMAYGHAHPNTRALEEVEKIFVGMGYEVVEGPEVEYDENNFEKLNIPAGHPARDEQDTFYINNNI
nr:phenylalanine--tRNA ligase subunit alpha [Oribacterium sp.]